MSPKSKVQKSKVGLLLLFVACLTAGCLKFGDDKEFLSPNVTIQHLQRVNSLTGVQFPPGTTGLAYLYLGSGIDDSLAIKVAIPPEKREDLLRNEVFVKGRQEAPHLQIGRAKPWWKLDALKHSTHRKLELPQGRFLECSLGEEDGKLVLYLSWIST